MPYTITIIKELNQITRAVDFAITENGSGNWYRDTVASLPAGDLQTILDGMATALYVIAAVPEKLVPEVLVLGYARYRDLVIISRALMFMDRDIQNAVALNILLFNAITILNESSFLFPIFNNERVGLGVTGTITTQLGINAISAANQQRLEQILRNFLNSQLAAAVSTRVELKL